MLNFNDKLKKQPIKTFVNTTAFNVILFITVQPSLKLEKVFMFYVICVINIYWT